MPGITYLKQAEPGGTKTSLVVNRSWPVTSKWPRQDPGEIKLELLNNIKAGLSLMTRPSLYQMRPGWLVGWGVKREPAFESLRPEFKFAVTGFKTSNVGAGLVEANVDDQG